MDSEDFPSFSRNEPLRLLLDALDVNDEEDTVPPENISELILRAPKKKNEFESCK